ncbi:MAG: phosphoglycerate kinase [Candidatus Bathyarchaeota archaeon]|nr:phosphoglycerate kinase [Candidatus Bathyarchaeota archaeon]MDH5787238.1 phosphoglycerate kinase [Candidatus Bathyarchaeota archaeon]
MARFLTLDDVKVKDKVTLVRVDFNSPIDPKTKKVLDDTRIRAHGETTIKELAQKGAKVVVLAHQGRQGDPDFTPLKQHAEILSKVLGMPVKYVDDVFNQKAQKAIRELKSGEVLVLENVRTFAAETNKGTPEGHAKTEMVSQLTPLANLFVNDAFAAAHRAHISIVGFTTKLPSAAGRIMEKELKSLTRVIENPEKPCIYILGGAKADDSLGISEYVLDNGIADYVLTGGVVGHVFLAAKDFDLGKPNMDFLQQKELLNLLPGIKELMSKHPEKIKVPEDIAVEVDKRRKEISVSKLPTNYLIFDVGAETVRNYSEIIQKAKSIVISGPMGVFENSEFVYGTKRIFEEVTNSKAFSLAGGGHTIAALEELGLTKKISYVSTAGGALIEFLMGGKLPGVVALKKTAVRKT